ncbi:RNA recognition domain-containing protein [Beauveria bassiana ARSEF 2860]|uniref:Nucleolar protein 12 n=1 Tax=Beauveria bassiana (strain ARSEF 2860) TaxID=655819 RepID=J5JXC6_BEAB2|nr:RNA recognition domain-containing protein [Beauveria bassiana ARSEF 2860]EJP66931.1 RNA recognition domain-containing protein [Beauveria bassiana ARSEF 2860]
MSKKTSLLASSKAVDPHLQALFASSAGPVSAPSPSRYQKLRESRPKSPSDDAESGDDEVLSEASEELDYEVNEDNDEDGDQESVNADTEESAEEESGAEKNSKAALRKERKRKRKDDNEDLEGKYFASLVEDDEAPSGKRAKSEATKKGSDSDGSDEDDGEDTDKEEPPKHESLSKEAKAAEADKAARTVFVSNVSSEAVSSKAAKRQLLAHFATVLDKDASPSQKVESIRFRSVAFSGGSMPKRAAYITKSVMEATTHSTNAYIVFSTTAAARRVCKELNGSEVLGRHIRVDSVAHPSPTDHRRCIFVGNLGFVDDETMLNTNKDGEAESKKRNKVPSDVEEGLWRTFSKIGKVENVRVVRDPKTRVGKGFAYVQFYVRIHKSRLQLQLLHRRTVTTNSLSIQDANAVEEALHLNDKSFPPMLPRKLRVTRAKDPRKTNQAIERTKSKFNSNNNKNKGSERNDKPLKKGAATYVPKMTPDELAAAGRAGKLFGRARAGASHGTALPSGIKAPERIVFEGRRASSRDALPKDLKKKVKTKRARPVTRSARRGADWKKKSGK